MDDVKKQQWRSRAVLLLIVALFFSSFGIAALLRFTGWQPDSHKNFGRLLSPPLDFSAQSFIRADGRPYAWQPERNAWRIVLVSDSPCLAACQKQLDTLHRVWLSRGRHTERIDLLWFAEVPATGAVLKKGGDAAVVESVKAASDVYAPVSGTVTEGNDALEGDPALVNTDPEGEGWFFKLTLSDTSELASLMDAAAYKAFVEAN